MLVLSLVLSVFSALSTLAILLAVRKMKVNPQEEVEEAEVEADAAEEVEDTEEDESFLGFPTQEIAEIAVSTLGETKFNVSCTFCKAKKPAWDVVACSPLPVTSNSALLTMVLSCPNCATVRLVNPKTLGVLTYDDAGFAIWKTKANNAGVSDEFAE